jgi:16S rRNA (cytosine1402-N4)-methyltransferase
MSGSTVHRPVLLEAVLAALSPGDGEVHVDATFGGGGYSKAILEAAQTRVYAIDRDAEAIAAGRSLAARFPGRLAVIEGRFSDMIELLASYGVEKVDGVAFDVGVSSLQIDEPRRGFSFQSDGPLDMRMEGRGMSAADAVNSLDESELARILSVFGEERRARAIARAIVQKRSHKPLERTSELVAVIESVLGSRRGDHIHPATRTFQALRIYVNSELEELVSGLEAAEGLLKPGGRLAVVTFHSLEDRIVKRFLAAKSGKVAGTSRHQPPSPASSEPTLRLVSERPVVADSREVAENPRSRSAKLRAAVRTEAVPAGPEPSLRALASGGLQR